MLDGLGDEAAKSFVNEDAFLKLLEVKEAGHHCNAAPVFSVAPGLQLGVQEQPLPTQLDGPEQMLIFKA
ncbi:hypothetical protein, partial [Ideonella sp. B508-1]|uniref:hypothetical protein n=1 Tax=Ideonella sp. B508-1 TaxID=137716 RepID=UPI00058BC5ED